MNSKGNINFISIIYVFYELYEYFLFIYCYRHYNITSLLSYRKENKLLES